MNDYNILKPLERIADSLFKIEKMLHEQAQPRIIQLIRYDETFYALDNKGNTYQLDITWEDSRRMRVISMNWVQLLTLNRKRF